MDAIRGRFCFVATAPGTGLGAPLPMSRAGGCPPAAAAGHPLPELPRPALPGHGHQPRQQRVAPGRKRSSVSDGRPLDATLAQVRKLNAAAVVVAGEGEFPRIISACVEGDGNACGRLRVPPLGISVLLADLVVNPLLAPGKKPYRVGPGCQRLLGSRFALCRGIFPSAAKPFAPRNRRLRSEHWLRWVMTTAQAKPSHERSSCLRPGRSRRCRLRFARTTRTTTNCSIWLMNPRAHRSADRSEGADDATRAGSLRGDGW